jgi:hypothetical protein
MTDSTNKPACVIVGLDEVMADAPIPLIDIRAAQPDDDILISWQVEMDVKGRGKERYHVCFGLGWSEDSLDALQTISQQICEPEHRSVFGYINVPSYGSDRFAIFVAQTLYGEVLVDGLVNEIVESAAIESAVISWASA